MSELRHQINPAEFWADDGNGNQRFQAYSFAEAMLETYSDVNDEPKFAADVDTGTLYWHDGRVWDRRGETLLKTEVRRIIKDAASTRRVNEVVANVKAQNPVRREQLLNLPANKLVVENGVIDLLTGELSRSIAKPGTLTYLDVKHDADAVPEHFNQFLFDVLPREDVSVMWEWIGYCLYRDYPFQKAAMFKGEGANGKSTLLAALREFLGRQNVSGVELQQLDRTENRFAVAGLEGKLANIAPDISDDDLKRTGTFKGLTGGDLITAERKRQQPFDFVNHAKLMFSANKVPDAGDNTRAYRRRWLYFDFSNIFSEDDPDTIPQEVLLQRFRDEHAGILNVAVESFRDLWERGGFEKTTYELDHGDRVHDRTTNPLYEFVEDEIVPAEGSALRIKDAYEAYRVWCGDRDLQPQGRQSHFEPAVLEIYGPGTGEDQRNRSYKVWFDLTLRGDGEAGGDYQADLPGTG